MSGIRFGGRHRGTEPSSRRPYRRPVRGAKLGERRAGRGAAPAVTVVERCSPVELLSAELNLIQRDMRYIADLSRASDDPARRAALSAESGRLQRLRTDYSHAIATIGSVGSAA